jgi:hypothetical protein
MGLADERCGKAVREKSRKRIKEEEERTYFYCGFHLPCTSSDVVCGSACAHKVRDNKQELYVGERIILWRIDPLRSVDSVNSGRC